MPLRSRSSWSLDESDPQQTRRRMSLISAFVDERRLPVCNEAGQ